jgi:hypothetical protein
MKNLFKLVLISTLTLGVFGCSANSAAKDAEEARVTAANVRADARVVVQPSNSTERPESRAVIPSGTLLKVTLADAVDSDKSSAGDLFLANLSEAVMSDGATLLQKGTQVRGRVVEAEGAGRIKGRASISLKLTDIVQGDRMIPITTNTYAATSDSQQGRDAGVIAGGAGVGAVIGAIAGGKKGAAIGAATGGGAGTGVVLATKGKQIHYGPETRLNFTLTNSVKL